MKERTLHLQNSLKLHGIGEQDIEKIVTLPITVDKFDINNPFERILYTDIAVEVTLTAIGWAKYTKALDRANS